MYKISGTDAGGEWVSFVQFAVFSIILPSDKWDLYWLYPAKTIFLVVESG